MHSDIGGGYKEKESGLSKFPLRWMIDEVVNIDNGLAINKTLYNHIVNDRKMKEGEYAYVGADATEKLYDLMAPGCKPLEWLPKSVRFKEWPGSLSQMRWYLPKSEHRLISENALIHSSVFERLEKTDYQPINLPKSIVWYSRSMPQFGFHF